MTAARTARMPFEDGDIPPIELRHKLRIAREYAGLSQDELAERSGIARSTVSNAEIGKVHTQRRTINMWALACGVPASWLTSNPDNGGECANCGLGIIGREAFYPASKYPRSASCNSLHKSVTGERSRMVHYTPGGSNAQSA